MLSCALSGRGNTPLIMAALHGHDKVVELLLGSGASMEVKDNNGLDLRAFAASGE